METEVEVTRQLARLRPNCVMIKHHRKTGKRAQTFAADTGCEVHILQIDRHGADQTDAVEAKPDASPGAQFFQRLHVIQNAGGGFAGGRPKPSDSAMAVERLSDLLAVEHTAPIQLQRVER